jgi:beta-phosphoglucomutase-like phosphatase (HAD superfamily)
VSVAVQAVVFDLDGVLVDSEQAWDDARKELVAEAGGTWTDEATRAMQGMSSKEWALYLRDELGVDRSAEEISAGVVDRLTKLYRDDLPAIPGARRRSPGSASAGRSGVASSSNRRDHRPRPRRARDHGALRRRPSPPRRSTAASRRPTSTSRPCAARVEPAAGVAVEDSENGIRSAHAAGLRVLAIPEPALRPAARRAGARAEVLPDLAP